MTGKHKERLKEKTVFLWQDKENLLFAVWIVWMAVYYGVRMFRLTPWYDELYTYYYFISRGPIYAAIHWPLPNNHVGYSVLSAFFDRLGSPVVGLRGVSCLSSLGSLLLLYRIGRKSFQKGWSLCCVILYSCMNLVNQLSVQGRGYALAAFCFLLSLFSLQSIFLAESEKENRKYYVLFAGGLVLGLYTLPSSVYWVLPLCLTGGLLLLMGKKTGRLLRLIVSSLAAALATVFLYLILWLAIGSNLLSKTQGSAWYGVGHVKIILSAPFAAAGTGIDYMLSTPYIQSVEREGFLPRFAEWLRALFDYYYTGMGTALLALTVFGAVFCGCLALRRWREGRTGEVLLPLLVTVFTVITPSLLVLQCSLPYFRVFSCLGIPVAICLCILSQSVIRGRLPFGIPIAALSITAVVLLLSKSYNREYGMTEYYARDALSHADLESVQGLCVTDCYEQYILKFYWGIECESTDLTEADYVLLHKDMEREDAGGFRWESYCTYQDIPWDYINENMTHIYGNEEYDLFRKNGVERMDKD